MWLESMDLWDIVDGSKEIPPFNVVSIMLKEYQRCVKKAMSIMGLNLVENQLAHIKTYKGPVEVWKIFCKSHEPNICFIRYNFDYVQDVRM